MTTAMGSSVSSQRTTLLPTAVDSVGSSGRADMASRKPKSSTSAKTAANTQPESAVSENVRSLSIGVASGSASAKEYYYVEKTPSGKRKAGPYTLNEMKDFLKDGTIDNFSLIWHKSFGSKWKHADDIPLLKQVLNDAVQQAPDASESPKNDFNETLLIASRDGDVTCLAAMIEQYKSQVF